MTTAPDFCGLCAELVDSLENARRIIQGGDGTLHINTAEFVLRRARTALATPPPEPPTDEELVAFLDTIDEEEISHLAMARAVLKRWG
jgi:hypothetical protein